MENDHKYKFIHPKQSCGVEFSSDAALKKHGKVHLPFAFKCPTCQKGFHYKYKWTITKTPHTDFVIRCKYPRCSKVYKSEDEYQRHYKTHSDASEYRCKICDKCFVENKNLKEHMSLHSDVLKYKCSICGKRYRWRSSLDSHTKLKHPPTPLPRSQHSPSSEY